MPLTRDDVVKLAEEWTQLEKEEVTNPNRKLTIVQAIRHSMDALTETAADYTKFLEQMFAHFYNALRNKPGVYYDVEHQLRHEILLTLHRMPITAPIEKFVHNVLALLHYLLASDSEENAIVCLKIIIDLHKTYKKADAADVNAFIDTVVKFYDQLPTIVSRKFEASAVSGGDESRKGGAGGAVPLVKSNESFKVIMECPIIIVLLFQLYPNVLVDSIDKLMTSMIKSILTPPPRNAQQINGKAFEQMLSAQVKTLSLVAYMLRSQQSKMTEYYKNIALCVVTLLRTCPVELSSSRKELLIAARHIMSSNVRDQFLPHMEVLLQESVIVGRFASAYETLRPLAFSTVADLTFQMREKLELGQLERAVTLFELNLHDHTLAVNMQVMSAKLLVNIADPIVNKNDQQERGLRLLLRMVDGFVNKLSALRSAVPHAVAEAKAAQSKAQAAKEAQRARKDAAAAAAAGAGDGDGDGDGAHADDDGAEERLGAVAFARISAESADKKNASGEALCAELDIGRFEADEDNRLLDAEAVATLARKYSDESVERMETLLDLSESRYSVKELRTLIKTLFSGIKQLTSCMVQSKLRSRKRTADAAAKRAADELKTQRAGAPPSDGQAAEDQVIQGRAVRKALESFDTYIMVLSRQEMAIMMRYVRDAIPCTDVFGEQTIEQKEALDLFASVLQTLDRRVFQLLVSNHTHVLYEAAMRNEMVLTVVQALLTNTATSRMFATVLLEYLVERLDELETRDSKRGAIMHKMLKYCFGSVSLFAENEVVLQPHLARIVKTCMEEGPKHLESCNHFILLRSLFRSLGQGKYEYFYRELMPLLPALLDTLNHMYRIVQTTSGKDMFVELALTVPVRLTHMMPSLHLLMQPLLMSLDSGSELVPQGLRLLEAAVEQLDPAYLDPILEPIKSELIMALWRHVRPPPYQHGHSALKVLGKLAGRTRNLVQPPARLLFEDGGTFDGLMIAIRFEGGISVTLPLDRVARSARKYLLLSNQIRMRQQGFLLLRVCLSALLRGAAPLAGSECIDSAAVRARLDEQIERSADEAAGASARPRPAYPDAYIASSDSAADAAADDEAASRGKRKRSSGAAAAAAAADADELPPAFAERPIAARLVPPASGVRTRRRLLTEEFSMRLLLRSVIVAWCTTSEALERFMDGFCDKLFRHFAVLCCLDTRPDPSRLAQLDPLIYLDAVIEIITSEPLNYAVAANRCIENLVETAVALTGSVERASQLPIFAELSARLCLCCERSGWARRNGGAMGITYLCAKLSRSFVRRHAVAHTRALLSALNNLSLELSALHGSETQDAFRYVLYTACGHRRSLDLLSAHRAKAGAREVAAKARARSDAKDADADHDDDDGDREDGDDDDDDDDENAADAGSDASSNSDGGGRRRRRRRRASDALDDAPRKSARGARRGADDNDDAHARDNDVDDDAVNDELGDVDDDVSPHGVARAFRSAAHALAAHESDDDVDAESDDAAEALADAARDEPLSFDSGGSVPRAGDDELRSIARFFVADLVAPNAATRARARESLALMARLLNRDVTTLVQPHYESELLPLLERSARLAAQPLPVQAGVLDGFAFVLKLHPALLEPTRELRQLVKDARAILARKEPSAASDAPVQPNHAQLQVAVRAMCVRVLAAAVEYTDTHQLTVSRQAYQCGGARNKDGKVLFDDPESDAKRLLVDRKLYIGVLSALFCALAQDETTLIDEVEAALAHLTAREALVKDVWQAALRPLLVMLNANDATETLLRALQRIVLLVPNCFSSVVCERLLQLVKNLKSPTDVQNEARQAQHERLAELKQKMQSLSEEQQKAQEPVFKQRQAELQHRALASAIVKMTKNERFIVAAIDFFALLPPIKEAMLELINLYMMRTRSTMRVCIAAMRDALLRFLNRFPRQTVELVLREIDNEEVLHIFIGLLAHPDGVELRNELASSASSLLNATLRQYDAYRKDVLDVMQRFREGVQLSEEARAVATKKQRSAHHLAMKGVALVRSLVRNRPEWIGEHREVRDLLLVRWGDPARMRELMATPTTGVDTRFRREHRQLVTCLVEYCRLRPDDFDMLFELLDVFALGATISSHRVERLLREHVAQTFTLAQRRALLERFVEYMNAPQTPAARHAAGFEQIVLPVLMRAARRRDLHLLFSKSFVTLLQDQVIVPRSQPGAQRDLLLRHQLLKALTLFVYFAPMRLVTLRPELSRYAWKQRKSHDLVARHWAHLVACVFIESFTVPQKIVGGVYNDLLRSQEPEVHGLVTRSLGVLVPTLPYRFRKHKNQHSPPWIDATKATITDSKGKVPEVSSVLAVIAVHGDVYYPYRQHFLNAIVSTLSRLGLLPTSNSDNRRLAVDLAEVVVKWEEDRIAGRKSLPAQPDWPEPPSSSAIAAGDIVQAAAGAAGDGAADGDAAATAAGDTAAAATAAADGAPDESAAAAAPAQEYEPSPQLRETVVNFLVRISSIGSMESRDAYSLPARGIELLKRALSAWPTLHIKFKYFDKLLEHAAENNINIVVLGLNILVTVLDYQLKQFVDTHLETFRKSLEPVVRNEQPKVVTALCNLLDKLLTHYKLDDGKVPSAVSQFYRMMDEVIAQSLKAFDETSASAVSSGVRLLSVFSKHHNSFVDRHLAALVKLVSRLAKAHISPPTRRDVAGSSAAADAKREASLQALAVNETLVRSLALVSMRFAHIGGHKQYVYYAVTSVLEKSADVELLSSIVKIVRSWIGGGDTVQAFAEQVGKKSAPSDAKADAKADDKDAKADDKDAKADDKDAKADGKDAKADGKDAKADGKDAKADGKDAKADGKESDAKSVDEGAADSKRKTVKAEPADDDDMDVDDKPSGDADDAAKKDADGVQKPADADSAKKDDAVAKEADADGGGGAAARRRASEQTMAAASTVLSAAEKIQLLLKMQRFELVSETSLQQTYMEMIYKVYVDPQTSDDERRLLQPCFFMGLRSRLTVIRRNFYDVFNRSMADARTLQERLRAIFAARDHRGLGEPNWVRHALDLMLCVASTDAESEVAFADGMGGLPLLPRADRDEGDTDDAAGTAADAMAVDGADGDERVSCDAFLRSHSAFMRSLPSLARANDFIAPLKDLMHQDVALAEYIWQLLFPQVWQQLEPSARHELAGLLEDLLRRDQHHSGRPSAQNQGAVFSVLDAVARCEHPAPLRPELLRHVGATHNAWHVSVALLERRLAPYCGAPATAVRSATLPPLDERVDAAYDAALALLDALSERDMWYGLWQRRASMPATRAALRLQQHGQWERAQTQLFDAMQLELAGADAAARQASLAECALWKREWLDAAKRLGQWELLTDYAKANDDTDLLVEAAWHVPEWPVFSEAVRRKLVAAPDDAKALVAQGYVNIYEHKPTTEIEAVYAKAVMCAMNRWNALPAAALRAKAPLLHMFQQIVELKESARIARDVGGAARNTTIADVRERLRVWRIRLPNVWEDLRDWSDLITWRQFVYSIVNTAYKPFLEHSEHIAMTGHHETAWSINRLAHIARKQGLVDVCLSMLSRIYQLPNIALEDAFAKLREQAKCYFQLPQYYKSGLDVIASTNLEYFGKQQKAEFFQLKGEFMRRMTPSVPASESNSAFATAVSLHSDLAKGWISWGTFCVAQVRQCAQLDFAEHAMVCLLEACRADAARSLDVMPRIFTLLALSGGAPLDAAAAGDADAPATAQAAAAAADAARGKMLDAFAAHSANLPTWIWLGWLPQAFARLRERDGAALRRVLRSVADKYPQALALPLRAHLARERERAAAQRRAPIDFGAGDCDGDGAAGDAVPVRDAPHGADIGRERAERLAIALHGEHPMLAAQLERLAHGLADQYALPCFEQFALLARAAARCTALDVLLGAAVPRDVRELLRALRDSFAASGGAADGDAFADAFAPWLRDDAAADDALASLERLVAELRRWQARVLSAAAGDALDVRHVSAALLANDFEAHGVELPCQYVDAPREPTAARHVRLHAVNPLPSLVVRGKALELQIDMMGDDGKQYTYALRRGEPALMAADARAEQLLRLVNAALLVHSATRSRDVLLSVPPSVPLAPNACLVRFDNGRTRSLEDLHHVRRAERGHGRVSGAVLFARALRERCATAHGADGAAASGGDPLAASVLTRAEALVDVRRALVPLDELTRALHDTFPDYAHLFEFRQTMLAHSGAFAALGAALGVGERAPSAHLLALGSGAVEQLAFYPRLTARDGALATPDAAPFRLTRTMQHFFGAAGIEGRLSAAIAATAQALVEQRARFGACIELCMADAVTAWVDERGARVANADVAHRAADGERVHAHMPHGAGDDDDDDGDDDDVSHGKRQASPSSKRRRRAAASNDAAHASDEPPLPLAALERRTLSNTDAVYERLSRLAPDLDAASVDISHAVVRLIRSAAADENLAKMPNSFRAWL